MYTLRIIDQTKVGAEERRNIFIGNNYTVLMKVKKDEKIIENEQWYSEFEVAFKEFYDGTEITIDDTIVGFVYANDTVYPIRDFNVVYIVGNDGQTFERVYGIYQKY